MARIEFNEAKLNTLRRYVASAGEDFGTLDFVLAMSFLEPELTVNEHGDFMDLIDMKIEHEGLSDD